MAILHRYNFFKEQDIELGRGADGVRPVKQGPQVKLRRDIAQLVMPIDFVGQIALAKHIFS